MQRQKNEKKVIVKVLHLEMDFTTKQLIRWTETSGLKPGSETGTVPYKAIFGGDIPLHSPYIVS